MIRSDDKRRARLMAMRHLLSSLDYDHKDSTAIGSVDKKVCGGPEIWDA